MSAERLAVEDWLTSAEHSVAEVASRALGSALRPGEPPARLEGAWAAFVSLTSDRHTVRVGLLASPQACETLARRLVQFDQGGRLEGRADVADAMCELLNMVAGALKHLVRHRAPGLEIGLPTFATEAIDGRGAAELSTRALQLGDVAATLAVVCSAQEA
jgi:hypothetical protein